MTVWLKVWEALRPRLAPEMQDLDHVGELSRVIRRIQKEIVVAGHHEVGQTGDLVHAPGREIEVHAVEVSYRFIG